MRRPVALRAGAPLARSVIETERPAIDLTGRWSFVRDPEHRLDARRLPAGEPIEVPGSWEAQLPQPYGIVNGWYTRRFSIPDDWCAGTLLLRFGRVMNRAMIWLDGRYLAQHEDGYLPFEVDAGPVAAGADHELTISVANPLNILVDYPAFGSEALRAASDRLHGQSFESLPHGKQTWYTSTSGLLGPVAVEVAPDPRLTSVLVLPDLPASEILVRWRLAGTRAAHPATTWFELTSPRGEPVARTSVDARRGEVRLHVPDVEAWDLWTPALYRLTVRLQAEGSGHPDGDTVLDDVTTVRFGMRSVAVADGAVVLNGRPIYLRGALDQDFWPHDPAHAPSRAALEAQAMLLRDMGLNVLRCHVKVPEPDYLDVADEAGMLVWCELPSWTRFAPDTGRAVRRLLTGMVEMLGNHPSVIAWTVINEDWGTDLRHAQRDRRWLRSTVDWLKAIDPNRLVVDNSACETPHGPNFHLRTDLADFHAYRSMPDGLPRWRSLVADFARRPTWLWSPYGDAVPTGDEPLVMSEFGGWGLPQPSAVFDEDGREPWWWATGQTFRRPAGLHRRFVSQRLDRIWPDVDALAEATQWRQFETLAAQLRELRRHASIRGFVVTELADTYWEANGLLDVNRARKATTGRIVEVAGPDTLIVDLPRSDLWSGENLACDVIASSFPDVPAGSTAGLAPTSLDCRVNVEGSVAASGTVALEPWPDGDARVIGRLEIGLPEVDHASCAELWVSASPSGRTRPVVFRQSIVVIPRRLSGWRARRINVVDPLDLWSVVPRVRSLGHQPTPLEDAEMIVTTHLDRKLLAATNAGIPTLVLARSADAIPRGIGVERPIAVRRRRPGEETPQHERPWDGDWCSVFAWALPGLVPGLPEGGFLGDPHGEVFPDHVLDGLDVAAPGDGVEAGLFSGWVHSPVALAATFRQGDGWLTVTTLQLAPEAGPVASALLDAVLARLGEPANVYLDPRLRGL